MSDKERIGANELELIGAEIEDEDYDERDRIEELYPTALRLLAECRALATELGDMTEKHNNLAWTLATMRQDYHAALLKLDAVQKELEALKVNTPRQSEIDEWRDIAEQWRTIALGRPSIGGKDIQLNVVGIDTEDE